MNMTKTSTQPSEDKTHDGDICENCGNVYRIELLKAGDEYNDFGQRYCPFCGMLIQEW